MGHEVSDIGKPLYWTVERHVEAVEQLIRADEIEMAIQMCDMVPSYYRLPERYPKELSVIKQVVARQLYDQIEYSNDDEEAECTREFGEAQADNGYQYPRLHVLEQIIGVITPTNPVWIFEIGCSHGNMPLALLKHGAQDWEYKGVGLNWRIVQKVREWVGDRWNDKPCPEKSQKTILYCTEVLEHCSRLEDIVTTALKECVDWDVVILSVPLNTLGGGLPSYTDRRLGHVRCFNEQDLYKFADKHWPGLKWEITLADSMVIVGRK